MFTFLLRVCLNALHHLNNTLLNSMKQHNFTAYALSGLLMPWIFFSAASVNASDFITDEQQLPSRKNAPVKRITVPDSRVDDLSGGSDG